MFEFFFFFFVCFHSFFALFFSCFLSFFLLMGKGFFLPLCLFIYLSVWVLATYFCMCIYLSFSTSHFLSVYPFAFIYIFINLSIHSSIHSTYLPSCVYLPIYKTICLSVSFPIFANSNVELATYVFFYECHWRRKKKCIFVFETFIWRRWRRISYCSQDLHFLDESSHIYFFFSLFFSEVLMCIEMQIFLAKNVVLHNTAGFVRKCCFSTSRINCFC